MENFDSSLSIEELVGQLIANSLSFQSKAIGVRYHASKQRVQILDNGIGISRGILSSVGENVNAFSQNGVYPKSYIFEKLRQHTNSLLITTRTTCSPVTYVKVFKQNSRPKIIEGIQRPSPGTTISIRGLDFSITEESKYLISNVVSMFALYYQNVSFSIRDDENQDVILRISKPHGPNKILGYICDETVLETFWYLDICADPNTSMKAYFGFTQNASEFVRRVYINAKRVICMKIENLLNSVLNKLYNLFLNNSPNKNVFYIVFIECPGTAFDFSQNADSLIVQFKNRNLIKKLKLHLKEQIIGPFFGSNENKVCNKMMGHVKQKSMAKAGKIDLKRKKEMKSVCLQIQLKKKMEDKLVQTESTWIKEDEKVEIIETQSLSIEMTKLSEQIEEQNLINLNYKKGEDNDDFQTAVISQWSDWNHEIADNVEQITINNINYYCSKREINDINRNQHFSFLPRHLHNLLKYREKRMVQNCELSQSEEEFSMNLTGAKFRHTGIRNIEKTENVSELKLTRDILDNITVLRQVNHEFIAAIATIQARKCFLLIDQHAIDERIRYEQLLEGYRVSGKRDEYIPKLLPSAIKIYDLEPTIVQIVDENRRLFKKYGVTLDKIEDTFVTVLSVPMCFQSTKYWNDDLRLINFTKKLLIEVAESIANTNIAMILPSSIHLAIATEACRGAIKFGYPLNIQQCQILLQTLKFTDGFSRCAHGRPSMVPILDVTNLNYRPKIKKLNYTSLLNRR